MRGFMSSRGGLSLSNRTNARTRAAGAPPSVTNTTGAPDGAPTAVGRSSRVARRTALAGRYMRKYTLAIATFVALAVPAAASANLTAAGPVDPASVPFPTFYDDGAGTSLGLCVNDGRCPASPSVFTNEAPNDEAFYMLASAEATGPQGQSVTMEFAIEAAWLGPTKPITFGRIQATLRGLVPNATYTVFHPWGESHFTAEPDGTLLGGKRAAQREETDGSFADTLNTPIGPFVRSVSAPSGYLGDGVSSTAVTGSPIRNYMRVTGPGLPEAVTQTDPLTGEVTVVRPAGITTDQFIVEGKLFNPNDPRPPAIVPVEPDTDGDGVIDSLDACKFQMGDAAHNGCPAPPPADTDRDGVTDDKDLCPGTPAGTTVLANGCEVPKMDPVPPIVIEKPSPPAKVIVKTVVQPVPAPAAGAPAVVKPLAPGRVLDLSVRKGRITGRTPAGANQVRVTVRKNGRVVRRISLHVKAGDRFATTVAGHGRYTVQVRAANEVGTQVALGATTPRSFRLR